MLFMLLWMIITHTKFGGLLCTSFMVFINLFHYKTRDKETKLVYVVFWTPYAFFTNSILLLCSRDDYDGSVEWVSTNFLSITLMHV